ncbi:acyltransferase domain-containing protein, partial [Streptomyces violaceoruber]
VPVPAAPPAQPPPAALPGYRDAAAQFSGHEDRRPLLAAVASPAHRTRSDERQVAVAKWPAQPRGAPVHSRTAVRTAPVAERPHLSVLLVQNRLTPGHNGFRPESMDEDFEHLNAVTRKQIERLGGEPVATIGAVTLGLFRPCSTAADGGTRRAQEPGAALRAVRAAAAVRDRLAVPVPQPARPAPPGLTFHASVATGRALVRFQPGDGTAPTVAFLFGGQGTQYPGMGRDLYDAHPVLARTLRRADAVLRGLGEIPLLDLLFDPDRAEDLARTRYCQPALVALEVALADLWTSCGVRPAAVLGHSVGALAAACVAGVLSLEDALTLAVVRGRAMDEQPGEGAMIACVGDPETVREIAAGHDRVALAAVNAPRNLVFSGAADRIAALRGDLERKGVTVRPLAVSHAFHSPLMAGA